MSDSDKEPENGSTASIPPLLLEDGDTSDGSMYKYRDFSQVPDQDDDAAEPPAAQTARGSLESSIRVQKFPVKLYAILAQKEFQDIITWMPHGRAWKVLKPNLFESLVMPLFFEYSNYHSFNRLVNAWSFRRISSGPDRGSYYHELFLRGKPHLQKYMRRLPKTHKKLPMKKEDEPDFYGLDKSNPLPTLEECPVPASTLMAMRTQPNVGSMMPSMQSVSPPPPTTGYNGFYSPKSQSPKENYPPQMDGRMDGRMNGMGGGRQMNVPSPQYGAPPHPMQQHQQQQPQQHQQQHQQQHHQQLQLQQQQQQHHHHHHHHQQQQQHQQQPQQQHQQPHHPRNIGMEPLKFQHHHQQGPPIDTLSIPNCGPPPPPSPSMGQGGPQHGGYSPPQQAPNGGGGGGGGNGGGSSQQSQMYHLQRMHQFQHMQMYNNNDCSPQQPPPQMMGRSPHHGPPQQQMSSHMPMPVGGGDGHNNMMRMQPNGIPNGGRSS